MSLLSKLGLVVAVVLASSAGAQDYPARSVKFLAPLGAGGRT